MLLLEHIARHAVLKPDVVICVAINYVASEALDGFFGRVEMEKHFEGIENIHALKRSGCLFLRKTNLKFFPRYLERTSRSEHQYIAWSRAKDNDVLKDIMNRRQDYLERFFRHLVGLNPLPKHSGRR